MGAGESSVNPDRACVCHTSAAQALRRAEGNEAPRVQKVALDRCIISV